MSKAQPSSLPSGLLPAWLLFSLVVLLLLIVANQKGQMNALQARLEWCEAEALMEAP